MTDQATKAESFRALHIKGDPLVLYNIWDAGSAKALREAGTQALATGSWSVAAAQGFEDGEAVPLDLVLTIVERIASTVDLPLSVDFEGGYAIEPDHVAKNVRRIIQAGAIGINLEDRIVGVEGLFAIQDQMARIKAVRQAADQDGINIFINARTDAFLQSDPSAHCEKVGEAIERAAAYKEAGADGFFVPGLTDLSLVNQVVNAVNLPVNVMMRGELTSIRAAADVGVSRVSYGPAPFIMAMSDLQGRFQALN